MPGERRTCGTGRAGVGGGSLQTVVARRASLTGPQSLLVTVRASRTGDGRRRAHRTVVANRAGACETG